jgi:putative transposase
MLVHQAFRYELNPTAAQRAAPANHAGAARWVWNWGLSVRHKACAPQEALRDLDRRFAVCSDGTVIDSPRALEKGLNRLRRRARAVSRKQRGSRNRARAALVLARLHRRIRNQRLDGLHKATTAPAKAKSVIVVEDLHVAGMMRNRRLARQIADRGWGEFHRQLAYKCQWYGSTVLVAPRFYPSSKRCSGCGQVTQALPLGARVFICERCGLVLDRDLNAARNLAWLAQRVAGSSPETINACGGGSAGAVGDDGVELPPVKQERARIHGHMPTNR